MVSSSESIEASRGIDVMIGDCSRLFEGWSEDKLSIISEVGEFSKVVQRVSRTLYITNSSIFSIDHTQNDVLREIGVI